MMTKDKKYKSLHRLLFTREDVKNDKIPIEDFYVSTMKLATQFLAQNYTDLDKRVADELTGIVNMGDKLTFEITRTMLLDLMNDIDRGD